MNGCIVAGGESPSFAVSGLTLSLIGVAVDEGEEERNAVDLTIFLPRLEIKFNGRLLSKTPPPMIAIDATTVAVAILRFRWRFLFDLLTDFGSTYSGNKIGPVPIRS